VAKEDRIRDVVNLWYGAGFGEVPWARALQATADAIGGGAAAVIGHNRTTSRVERIHVYGVDDTVNEYVARMSQINPRTRYSMELPGPHVLTDYRVLPEAALGRNEFYDWLGRHHGLRYFVGSRIYDEGPRSLLASVEFTRRHGHADEDIVNTFAQITPHIANAWRVSTLIEQFEGAKTLIETLASQRLCGVVGLRGDGGVLFTNTAAEEAIRSADGLAVIDGQLRAARAANDRTLQEIIARVLRSGPDAPPHAGGADFTTDNATMTLLGLNTDGDWTNPQMAGSESSGSASVGSAWRLGLHAFGLSLGDTFISFTGFDVTFDVTAIDNIQDPFNNTFDSARFHYFNVTASIEDRLSVTPLPAALPLFASGLGALGFIGWRKKRKIAARHAA
jgi:hypothetical protein